MRQGMDRGNPAPERRGTSRVSKPGAPAGKPATGRMQTQGSAQKGSGTSRREREQEQRQGGAAPAQEQSKSMLYIGIGGGALVFVLILAFMLGGESSPAGSGGGAGADTIVNRAIAKATEAHQRGEYRSGLDICEDAMKDPKARKSSRFKALEALASSLRTIVNLDKTAQEKVGEFVKRIEAAKADQTAIA